MGINIPEVERQKASKALNCDRQCPLWVKSGHVQLHKPCPLYPQKRTCAVQLADVRFVPIADHAAPQKGSLFDHLVGALLSSVGGTSRPSALAVLRLITSSNLTGAWTGSSLGFAPLRMRSA